MASWILTERHFLFETSSKGNYFLVLLMPFYGDYFFIFLTQFTIDLWFIFIIISLYSYNGLFSNLNIKNMLKVVAELFLFRYLRNEDLKNF